MSAAAATILDLLSNRSLTVQQIVGISGLSRSGAKQALERLEEGREVVRDKTIKTEHVWSLRQRATSVTNIDLATERAAARQRRERELADALGRIREHRATFGEPTSWCQKRNRKQRGVA